MSEKDIFAEGYIEAVREAERLRVRCKELEKKIEQMKRAEQHDRTQRGPSHLPSPLGVSRFSRRKPGPAAIKGAESGYAEKNR